MCWAATARLEKHVIVERLDRFDKEEDQWQEAVVQDTRSAPVPDIVAFRCDFAAWLRSLPRRDRRITATLALGNRTSEVAKRFNVRRAGFPNSAANWRNRGGPLWAICRFRRDAAVATA